MVRYRIMAMLGSTIEVDGDEMKSLSGYVKDALRQQAPPVPLLTTISTACSA